MRAIILTAGQGSRLRPLTDHCPKGMIEIGGQTLIERQIKLFRKVGIKHISIVKGYKAESVITDSDVKHYVNKSYQSTNMLHTLFCAEEQLVDDIIVSYGDILYSEEVLQKLVQSQDEISVVVDMDWKEYFTQRFGNPYVDAESLRFGSNDRIISIGETSPNPSDVQAQYIGLIRLRGNGLSAFKSIYDSLRTTNRFIGWGRNVNKAYMTDMLQELISQQYMVKAVRINRNWWELDNINDYKIAINEVETGIL